MNAELLFLEVTLPAAFKACPLSLEEPHFTTELLKVESSLFRAVSPGNILASMI